LAIVVVLAAAAILIPVAVKTQNKNLMIGESGRMRQVYIALMSYEALYDNMPAPNLVAASTYDPNHLDYLSALDPFIRTVSPSGYPMDPGLQNGEISPFRISVSYLPNFMRAGKIMVKPWAVTRDDPRIGELADEWYGSVNPGSPFQAQVGGRLLRVNTDGSVYVLPDRGGPKPLGDAQDLFIKR
jgi:hypothetical protein